MALRTMTPQNHGPPRSWEEAHIGTYCARLEPHDRTVPAAAAVSPSHHHHPTTDHKGPLYSIVRQLTATDSAENTNECPRRSAARLADTCLKARCHVAIAQGERLGRSRSRLSGRNIDPARLPDERCRVAESGRDLKCPCPGRMIKSAESALSARRPHGSRSNRRHTGTIQSVARLTQAKQHA
jgi:hypothetical protein